ncbi:MAG TPA: glycosyltransferase [Thermoleophilia bacterium]|nr:glycosyltransferase [Thermoleophilia bacterium]
MLKDALPNGGAERQLALLMRHLPDDVERRVWTMGGGPFVEEIESLGYRVEIARRAARFDVRPAISLWKLMASWRPDVVHSWNWMCSLAAIPACRLLGIPLVDGSIRSGIAPRRVLVSKLCQHAATRVVANSEAGLRAWGVGGTKGRVVYNGLDPERLPSHVDPGGTSRRPGTVVMTGRMVPQKDFSSLISAARELDAREPGEWRFLLVGVGPDRRRLTTLAGDLVEHGTVEFIDGGVDVMPFVREAHIGVLMSHEAIHKEGCSNAMMEFMASGLPVVCSGGGGNPELVVDGVTGFLVSAGDWRALVVRLVDLKDHPDSAEMMGEAGLTRIREKFGIKRMVQRWLEIYGEIA